MSYSADREGKMIEARPLTFRADPRGCAWRAFKAQLSSSVSQIDSMVSWRK